MLAVDSGGPLWVGTFGGGLNRFDPARESFQRFRHNPGRPSSLSSDAVNALHFDAAGILWVGTQIGLNRLEAFEGDGEASFRHWFERDGLANDSVWGIQSDAEGRLWISTNNGLSRFDPRAGEFTTFRSDHGLQSNEFNFGAHYR